MTRSSHDNAGGRRGRIRFADRVLAETVRVLEQDGASPRDDSGAVATARMKDGDFEERVVHRAAALPEAPKVRDAISSVRQAVGWIVLLLLILALLAGSGAARAALGAASDGEPVNIFWVLGSLLGLQTALLAMWLIVFLFASRHVNASPIGAAAFAIGRRIVAKLHPDAGAPHAAAVQAVGSIYGRGAIGRWMLSAVSHATWMMFNLGCVITLLMLLSWKHYTFHWETTILSEDAYARMTEAMARLPEVFGFLVPDPGSIGASEAGADPATLEQAQQQWSGFLVGCVVVYALMPRFMLMIICFAASALASRRFRVDLPAPGYLRLKERLMPSAESTGVVAGDDGESGTTEAATAIAPSVIQERPPGEGPPVVMGLEIEPPATPWPPRLHSVRWVDLGFIDGRSDRSAALDELRRLPDSPRATVVVCALTTTPDRGIGEFIRRVQEASAAPVCLVLTGGESLRRRGDGDGVARRVEDWRRLASELALAPERTIELDLDHLTEASARKLATLVSAGAAPAQQIRRLEEAFQHISAAAKSWRDAPEARQVAELHRDIAEQYQHESRAWWRELKLPASLPRDASALREQMTQGAGSLLAVLPDRLKRSPKWLAAGALSGAMGCIAVSLLISPVAIGSLPIWSGLGSAIAAALQPGGHRRAEAEEAHPELSVEEALRSAALFALLLELQGRDEATITEVLDQTIPDDAFAGALAEEVDATLREIRHRFDLALQEVSHKRPETGE